MPCGRLTKGSHPDDDLVPCGTRLRFGVGRDDRREMILLCKKCQEKNDQT